MDTAAAKSSVTAVVLPVLSWALLGLLLGGLAGAVLGWLGRPSFLGIRYSLDTFMTGISEGTGNGLDAAFLRANIETIINMIVYWAVGVGILAGLARAVIALLARQKKSPS